MYISENTDFNFLIKFLSDLPSSLLQDTLIVCNLSNQLEKIEHNLISTEKVNRNFNLNQFCDALYSTFNLYLPVILATSEKEAIKNISQFYKITLNHEDVVVGLSTQFDERAGGDFVENNSKNKVNMNREISELIGLIHEC